MEYIKTIGCTLSALTLSLSLVACSGSGKAPAVQTGRLVDAAVQGATYKAAPSGLSGVTDANGNYQYQTGDKVIFSFGNIIFPEVTATGTVTPLTLAGSSDINNKVVVNIARFLQSLDANGNPDDGIVIDPAKVADAPAFDFTQNSADFEADFKAAFPTDSLVTVEEAIDHLQQELDKLEEAIDHLQQELDKLEEDVLPAGLSGKSFDLYRQGCVDPGVPINPVDFSFASNGTLTITFLEAEPGFDGTFDSFTRVGPAYRWMTEPEGHQEEELWTLDVLLDEQGELELVRSLETVLVEGEVVEELVLGAYILTLPSLCVFD